MKRMNAMPALLVALTLAACTGSSVDTGNLQPLTSDAASAPAGSGQPLPPPGAASMLPATTVSAPTAPAGPIRTSARIQFAPVIGATQEALPALSMRLAARAGQRGIPLAPHGSAPTYLIRGYFSAFTENRETTIIYVWDVLGAAGNRVHRIQGQQKLPSGSEQGWRSVTPATMEAIADRTIDEMAMWLSTATG